MLDEWLDIIERNVRETAILVKLRILRDTRNPIHLYELLKELSVRSYNHLIPPEKEIERWFKEELR